MYPEASFGLECPTGNNGLRLRWRTLRSPWRGLKGQCARDFHLQLSTATVAEPRDLSIVRTSFRAAHIPPLSVTSLNPFSNTAAPLEVGYGKRPKATRSA